MKAMHLYKLGEEMPSKLVLPLPPPAAPQPQQPQQQQNPQQQVQKNVQLDKQVADFINRNKSNLPKSVRSGLANSQMRDILVSTIESMSDPENQQFLMRFVQFVKSMTQQKQQVPQQPSV